MVLCSIKVPGSTVYIGEISWRLKAIYTKGSRDKHLLLARMWGGIGGGKPGVMGAGSLREVGEEGAEGGTSKGGRSREK